MVLYQYFIEVVPTDVTTFLSSSYTYQYSVKDHLRLIDHHKGLCSKDWYNRLCLVNVITRGGSGAISAVLCRHTDDKLIDRQTYRQRCRSVCLSVQFGSGSVTVTSLLNCLGLHELMVTLFMSWTLFCPSVKQVAPFFFHTQNTVYDEYLLVFFLSQKKSLWYYVLYSPQENWSNKLTNFTS